ncbi:MAG: DNA-3-methyladenine glycosylase I, partial [Exiguobacterium sp.]|nr:DNA-3-methyladenine glycosylase I [Exiguobacterium sp.]
GIVRNRRKIEASINNAKQFIKLQEEFGSFDSYIWSFVNDAPILNAWNRLEDVPATTELSERLSKDLKRRGFKFLGPTTVYAHLQATGLVNDHLTSCTFR